MISNCIQRFVRPAIYLICASLIGLGTGSAHADDPIKIGILATTGSSPIFIADERGYFKAEGLKADIHLFSSAHEVTLATASGDVTVGLAGLGVSFYNLAGGGALKIIGAQSRDEVGFPTIAVITAPADQTTITSIRDMAGKRVGFTTMGSGTHYPLVLLTEKFGLNLADIMAVPLQSVPNISAAVIGKQVDFGITTPNAAQQLESKGKARILLWVGNETPWQLGALWTNRRSIEQNCDLLERFVRAYQRGTADYHAAFNRKDPHGSPVKGPGYDELLELIASKIGQPKEVISTAMPYVDPRARIDIKDVGHQIEVWQRLGLVRPEVKLADVIDLSFISEPYPGVSY